MFGVLLAVVMVVGTAVAFGAFVIEFGWLVAISVFGLYAVGTARAIYKVNHDGLPSQGHPLARLLVTSFVPRRRTAAQSA